MATEQIKEIIGKAIVDEEFRDLLFSDPDKALEGYELSAEEFQKMKALEREGFDQAAGKMEERISRAGLALAIEKIEIAFGDITLKRG